ncbi:MAG: DNA adenine methylase [Cyclobacteriaceae bacterium]
MDYYSPLRYPGGKGKLSKFIGNLVESNLLTDGCYVEPYAGGSSVALNLLFKEYVRSIVINDLDKAIYSFWYSVLYDTDNLCRMIHDTKVTVGNWEKQRATHKQQEGASLLELGFSTFYLNRTNRSGIINAGIIGGKGQNGHWKIDARFNKKDLIERIQKIADFKDRIQLYNLDACQLVNKISKKIPRKTLFYFDPPYFVKGKDLYTNFYKYKDHKLVSDTIKELNCHWIVTYDNQPEIKKLYTGFRKVEYSLNYHAASPKIGSELIIFSKTLHIPRIKRDPKLQFA